MRFVKTWLGLDIQSVHQALILVDTYQNTNSPTLPLDFSMSQTNIGTWGGICRHIESQSGFAKFDACSVILGQVQVLSWWVNCINQFLTNSQRFFFCKLNQVRKATIHRNLWKISMTKPVKIWSQIKLCSQPIMKHLYSKPSTWTQQTDILANFIDLMLVGLHSHKLPSSSSCVSSSLSDVADQQHQVSACCWESMSFRLSLRANYSLGCLGSLE